MKRNPSAAPSLSIPLTNSSTSRPSNTGHQDLAPAFNPFLYTTDNNRQGQNDKTEVTDHLPATAADQAAEQCLDSLR